MACLNKLNSIELIEFEIKYRDCVNNIIQQEISPVQRYIQYLWSREVLRLVPTETDAKRLKKVLQTLNS
jgi:hypothetical protein